MTTGRSQQPGVDRQRYVETVRATLFLYDIDVGTAAFSPGHGHVHSAAMTLLPPDDDFDGPWHHTFTSAQFVELRWDEREGWSLLALHAAGPALLPTAWHKGFPSLAPEEICSWLAALLVGPTVSAARTAATSCTPQSAAAPTIRLR